MARNGAPPKPKEGRRCKVPYCQEAGIESHLFCSVHEMAWIGVARVSSHKLQPKHGRRYRRFLKKEGEKIMPRVVAAAMNRGRLLFIRGGGKSWRMPSGK